MSDYQVDHIEEPKLCFRYGQKAENPKDGLFLFGPVEDRANPARNARRCCWYPQRIGAL